MTIFNFSQNFLSKAPIKKALIDNHYKTVYRSVRSEFSSYMVVIEIHAFGDKNTNRVYYLLKSQLQSSKQPLVHFKITLKMKFCQTDIMDHPQCTRTNVSPFQFHCNVSESPMFKIRILNIVSNVKNSVQLDIILDKIYFPVPGIVVLHSYLLSSCVLFYVQFHIFFMYAKFRSSSELHLLKWVKVTKKSFSEKGRRNSEMRMLLKPKRNCVHLTSLWNFCGYLLYLPQLSGMKNQQQKCVQR